MELLLLPDDELLAVLHHLDVRSLLTCRLVCKRLGALALSGEVWRHRELRLRQAGPGVLTLPLPPRLGHLHLRVDLAALRALTSMDCTVASLTLNDAHLTFRHPVYAQVVARQEELGRLRRVNLVCKTFEISNELQAKLAARSRLESLTLSSIYDTDFCSWSSQALVPLPAAPSLKRFSSYINNGTLEFVRAILTGHSATLEDVELRGYNVTDTVAPLLAALPRLESLCLSLPIPGLKSLAGRALRKLRVGGACYDADIIELVELLRSAKQLRDVRLSVGSTGLQTQLQRACNVMEALASPVLERLELYFLFSVSSLVSGPARFSTAIIQALLRLLPLCPALRHLALPAELDVAEARDLLRGITPTSAPALRDLQLKLSSSSSWCPHSWIHEDVVRTALIVNSSLRIQFIVKICPTAFPLASDHKSVCNACLMGCHKDLWEGVGPYDDVKLSLHFNENKASVKIVKLN